MIYVSIFFANRIVNIWNSLPSYVVCAETVNCFKTRLDRYWLNQDITYNFRSEIHGTGSRSEITVISSLDQAQQCVISRAKRLSPAPVFFLRLRLLSQLHWLPVNSEFGNRSFSYLAPTVWNGLLLNIRLSPTFDTFKRRMKTHLFKCPSTSLPCCPPSEEEEEEVYLPMQKKITMAGCQYRLKPIKAGCQQ